MASGIDARTCSATGHKCAMTIVVVVVVVFWIIVTLILKSPWAWSETAAEQIRVFTILNKHHIYVLLFVFENVPYSVFWFEIRKWYVDNDLPSGVGTPKFGSLSFHAPEAVGLCFLTLENNLYCPTC
jgi:hypothetical protein